ncbi:MAG: Hsp20/alpha crystallin family protein [Planctomycetota bacterium]|jgi:HSP20 family protein
MRLIPWNKHLAPNVAFHTPMNRMFEDFFGDLTAEQRWLPAVDVKETDTDVIVHAEIPGIDPKTVEVDVHGDVLTLKGEKSESNEEKGENWHRVERRYGSFTRAIPLPVEVDPEKAVAEADNGVLTITLGKKAGAIRRTIDVQVK